MLEPTAADPEPVGSGPVVAGRFSAGRTAIGPVEAGSEAAGPGLGRCAAARRTVGERSPGGTALRFISVLPDDTRRRHPRRAPGNARAWPVHPRRGGRPRVSSGEGRSPDRQRLAC
ncbi:hypothetical protein FRAAL1775 [Frankia alni ACN14a]|uniref:Uncharacterized protein n=1 Tax=Frankia alni (strain DSM 45986 / CECT 9034 / ACN14a) TaxID=326424 RepID=Q0RPV2_FRAAA|nr:hypothetical protein FRAAL1775 [Frankia alni ACN14a]